MASPEVNGCERFSTGVVNCKPGNGHERYVHPDSDEISRFISRTGEQTITDEAREVGPGEMFFIPSGFEHGATNTGWEMLQFLVVYFPPDPEVKLTDLPEVRNSLTW